MSVGSVGWLTLTVDRVDKVDNDLALTRVLRGKVFLDNGRELLLRDSVGVAGGEGLAADGAVEEVAVAAEGAGDGAAELVDAAVLA